MTTSHDHPLPRHLRPAVLVDATLITTSKALRAAFARNDFYYQYCKKRGMSRVMTCRTDDASEIDHVAAEIDRGATVQILPYGPERKLAKAPARRKSMPIAKSVPVNNIAKPQSSAPTLLLGETVRSPEKLRLAFQRGAFQFQVLHPPERIEPCKEHATLERLASIVQKRPVVVRPL